MHHQPVGVSVYGDATTIVQSCGTDFFFVCTTHILRENDVSSLSLRRNHRSAVIHDCEASVQVGIRAKVLLEGNTFRSCQIGVKARPSFCLVLSLDLPDCISGGADPGGHGTVAGAAANREHLRPHREGPQPRHGRRGYRRSRKRRECALWLHSLVHSHMCLFLSSYVRQSRPRWRSRSATVSVLINLPEPTSICSARGVAARAISSSALLLCSCTCGCACVSFIN